MRSAVILPLFLAIYLIPSAGRAETADNTRRPLNLRADASVAADTASSAALDWHARYDRAVLRKASGKRKVTIGGWLGALGLGLTAYFSSNPVLTCDSHGRCWHSAVDATGQVAVLVAGGLAVWGGFEWADANGDLSRLALEREEREWQQRHPPSCPTGLSIGVSGSRATLEYHVGW